MKVKEMILRGDKPLLPKEIMESEDPAIKALVEARDAALAYEVKDRSSAREVANILDAAVSRLSSHDKKIKKEKRDAQQ